MLLLHLFFIKISHINMKIIKSTSILIFIATVFGFSKAKAQVSFGNSQLFNTEWLFNLGNTPEAKNVKFDDSNWRSITLPHDWSIEGTPSSELASCTGYLPGGIAWYRKHFKIIDDKAKHYIYFEGIYNRSEVYLNGHLLGKRPNGYISFMYDMTPYLKKEDNILSVRVDHSKYADSRWYTGSGIYRNVWLISAGKTHFAQWGLSYNTINISNEKATVNINFKIDKSNKPADMLKVNATLIDASGKEITNSVVDINDKCTFTVLKPYLWSTTNPYLYKVKVQLLCNNTVIDTTSLRIGIRSLQFDANKGFALNGEWMKVKGVCIHHDAGVLGSAVPHDVWYRRLLTLKKMGVNGLRMSHNVQSPDIYDLADEMGFLIMDEGSDEWEFAKRKWIKGWNQGTPGYDGTFDFFEKWIDTDITDMVRRDRNHPSVFLWSVGNEVDYPNDPYTHPILNGDNAGISQPMYGGYKKDAPRAERIGVIAKRLAACIRKEDTSRPVTGAMAGVMMSNQTDYPNAIDICGYNYTENRYIEDHKDYPKRIIYGSETSTNLSSWKAVRDNEHIFGHFIWTGIDYLGESGAWPSRGLNTGLVDFSGFIKPRGRFFQSLWSTKPMAYIGTQPVRNNNDRIDGRDNNLSTDAWDSWNYQEGQIIRVLCYTNQPYAHLLLNEKEVGKKKKYDDTTGIIYWDIPYEQGILRVEGIDEKGNALAYYEIKTNGEAKQLHAYIDRQGYNINSTIVHVILDIEDSKCNRVLQYNKEAKCEVLEGGKLLGLENSNNFDMSAPKLNHRTAHRGRLLAYIQKTEPKQRTKVRFSAEGFTPVEIEF